MPITQPRKKAPSLAELSASPLIQARQYASSLLLSNRQQADIYGSPTPYPVLPLEKLAAIKTQLQQTAREHPYLGTPEMLEEVWGQIATYLTHYIQTHGQQPLTVTLPTPSLHSPLNQILWGSFLASNLLPPPSPAKARTEETSLQLHKALLATAEISGLATQVYSLLQQSTHLTGDIRVVFANSIGHYPSIGYAYSEKAREVSIDPAWSLIIGLDTSIAPTLHEIHHAEGTRASRPAREAMEALDQLIQRYREAPQSVTEQEMQRAGELSIEAQLRHILLDATENNFANAGLSRHISPFVSLHPATLLNTTFAAWEPAIRESITNIAAIPPEALDSGNRDILMMAVHHLRSVIDKVFFSHNHYFPDTEEGWRSMGFNPDLIMAAPTADGQPALRGMPALRELQALAAQHETLTLSPEDRQRDSAYQQQRSDSLRTQREEVAEHIYQRFFLPFKERLLMAAKQQSGDQQQQQSGGQQQQQQPGDQHPSETPSSAQGAPASKDELARNLQDTLDELRDLQNKHNKGVPSPGKTPSSQGQEAEQSEQAEQTESQSPSSPAETSKQQGAEAGQEAEPSETPGAPSSESRTSDKKSDTGSQSSASNSGTPSQKSQPDAAAASAAESASTEQGEQPVETPEAEKNASGTKTKSIQNQLADIAHELRGGFTDLLEAQRRALQNRTLTGKTHAPTPAQDGARTKRLVRKLAAGEDIGTGDLKIYNRNKTTRDTPSLNLVFVVDTSRSVHGLLNHIANTASLLYHASQGIDNVSVTVMAMNYHQQPPTVIVSPDDDVEAAIRKLAAFQNAVQKERIENGDNPLPAMYAAMQLHQDRVESGLATAGQLQFFVIGDGFWSRNRGYDTGMEELAHQLPNHPNITVDFLLTDKTTSAYAVFQLVRNTMHTDNPALLHRMDLYKGMPEEEALKIVVESIQEAVQARVARSRETVADKTLITSASIELLEQLRVTEPVPVAHYRS